MTYQHLLLTDLDGTLLDPQRALSPAVLRALEGAGARRVARVVATGRSLVSVRRVLPDRAPIDFMIYSSGAGVCRWPGGETLRACSMESADVRRAAEPFVARRIDFMVHDPVPESHRLAYAAFDEGGPIWRRVSMYAAHARALHVEGATVHWEGKASQLVAMLETDDAEAIHRWAAGALPRQRVVRTTSPLDDGALWLEVFPEHVSKASAGAFLAAELGIAHERTYAIGNDYNDLCMLTWAATSRVVENAPADLHARLGTVRSNAQDGVADALERFGLLG